MAKLSIGSIPEAATSHRVYHYDWQGNSAWCAIQVYMELQTVCIVVLFSKHFSLQDMGTLLVTAKFALFSYDTCYDTIYYRPIFVDTLKMRVQS